MSQVIDYVLETQISARSIMTIILERFKLVCNLMVMEHLEEYMMIQQSASYLTLLKLCPYLPQEPCAV